eukprot:CAMPEP_0182471878 /NCGR_PEP_ID=MMETSP1319-20130603/21148_1 /TAXON_ID=172717 /ORGANISM="Bolidomonas pacifica, Strain RCC208" /LENGTH=201 /DNA_ID=CAMNT_0024672479 /DNA_START=253 /DNA_END=855 /DNA_ORIENTATION=-
MLRPSGFLLPLLLSLLISLPFPSSPLPLVLSIDGGTESIRACVFDASTGKPVGSPCATPYNTSFPRPGWATQSPTDWYECMKASVSGALMSASAAVQDDAKGHVEAVCVDTTCCSVCFLDEGFRPVEDCMLWMDSRSSEECDEIMERAKGDPALEVNSGGEGPVSAEWMLPKCMWFKKNLPGAWARVRRVCEYQDYVNFRL